MGMCAYRLADKSSRASVPYPHRAVAPAGSQQEPPLSSNSKCYRGLAVFVAAEGIADWSALLLGR